MLGLVENDTAVKMVVIACTGETDNDNGIDENDEEEDDEDNDDRNRSSSKQMNANSCLR